MKQIKALIASLVQMMGGLAAREFDDAVVKQLEEKVAEAPKNKASLLQTAYFKILHAQAVDGDLVTAVREYVATGLAYAESLGIGMDAILPIPDGTETPVKVQVVVTDAHRAQYLPALASYQRTVAALEAGGLPGVDEAKKQRDALLEAFVVAITPEAPPPPSYVPPTQDELRKMAIAAAGDLVKRSLSNPEPVATK